MRIDLRFTRQTRSMPRRLAIFLSLCAAFLPALPGATAPPLGTASSFAVLGGSAVTNTGPTVLTGDLGVSPGSAISGFPPGIVVPPGVTHQSDAPASLAQNDATTAYNALAGQACNTNLTGQDLGGLTLLPGVYCFSSSAQLTGTLTLDAQGNPGAVFIIKVGSALTTASNSSVNIINGGSLCNVFWQVGSSATLGTTTSFKGNILALTSITLNTNAGLTGRALARNGAVTLDTNAVSVSTCNATPGVTPVIAKSFGTATAILGASASLSFIVTNPNGAAPLTSTGFTDTLPAGLSVSTPPNLIGSCGGGTITATAGSGSVSLSGATLPANGTCTFSVNVTSSALGPQNNSVAVIDATAGAGNTSLATLTIVAAPLAFPPTITKSFAPVRVAIGGSATLTFTATNPNAVASLTGIGFVDSLPSGLVVATPPNLIGSCGGGTITAAAGSGSVSLSGATLAGNGTCSFSVNVTAVAGGPQNNSVTVIDTIAGTGTTSNATLTVVLPPAIAKVFDHPVIDLNGGTGLTFTLTNPNPTVTLTGVNFTDTLPAGLAQVGGGVGLSLTCGVGAGINVTGTNLITVTGVTLAPGATCVMTVTNIFGIAPGAFTNVTSAIASVEGGPGLTASAPITVTSVISAEGEYQVRYFANLDKGDSYINLTNAGTLNGFDTAGRICVNTYTFDSAEELISCCSCMVTPNGLNSLSARNDLVSNTLTPGVPTAITVDLIATTPIAGICNPSSPTQFNLVRGMRAWATTLHQNTSGSPAVGYQETATPFSSAELSLTQLAKLTGYCSFIQANGSGFGICKSCRSGAQGAASR